MSTPDDTGTDRGETVFRRDLLQAVGTGGLLVAMGTATGAGGDHGGKDGATVYTVRTLIRPPTSDERPADFYYQPTGLAIDPGDVIAYVFEMPDHTVTSYHPAYGMRRRIPKAADAFSSPLLGWKPDSLPDGIVDPPSEGNGTDHPEPATSTNATESGTATAAATPSTPAEGTASGGPEPSVWLKRFEEPGVYDIECAPHEGFGMAMRVVVGGKTKTNFETSDPDALPEPRAGPVGLARVTLTDPALQPQRIVDAGRVEWLQLEANQQQTPKPTESS